MPDYRLDAAELRKRAQSAGDLTDEAIADRIGVKRTTINRLMAARTRPSLPTVMLLGKAYSATVEELVMEVEAV